MDYKKYNALCGGLRQLAHKLSQLDPDSDPTRKKIESEVLDKLWRLGILKQSREQGAGLSRVEREVTVSAFCRRRLGVIMVRTGMVENIKTVRFSPFSCRLRYYVSGGGADECRRSRLSSRAMCGSAARSSRTRRSW